jgi:hypothetical protein
MSRLRTFVLLVLSSVFVWPAVAEARYPISPNNPYRSFNISGINYGSMQWEKEHRGRTRQSSPARRGLFRR